MLVFIRRLGGALRLDVDTYEEVEADRSSIYQALLVVLLSSLSAGLGMASSHGPGMVLALSAASIFGWVCWAWIAYVIGTRLLPEPSTEADLGQLLRTTGFSGAAGIVRILGVVPALRTISLLVASLWMLAAFVVAVRQALDYQSTARAIAVCLIGWAVYVALFVLLDSLAVVVE